MQTPPDLLTLSANIIRLVSQTQPTLNTFLFKTLAKKYGAEGKERKKLSDKIRYCLKKLEKLGIITINRISARISEIWLSNQREALDLITLAGARNQPEKPLQHEQPAEKHDFWQVSAEALSPYRLRASSIFHNIANKTWLKSRLNEDDIYEVVDAFEEWQEMLFMKVLLFEKPNGELELKNPKTRFTDPAEALKNLKTLENAFKLFIQQYDKAVFLTITLPPVFPIKISFYILSFLLHRIKAILRKQYNETLPHIKVIEPQKTYNPHIHVIIAGTDFIIEKRQLTKYLDKHLQNFLTNLGEYYKRTINKRAKTEQVNALNKLGKRLLRKYRRYKKKKKKYEGPVNWLTKINIQQEQAFFENEPPKRRFYDGGQSSVWDYIKFYITQAVAYAYEQSSEENNSSTSKKRKKANPEFLAFYWLFRTPFFTISPKLRVVYDKPPPAGWRFLGSYWVWELSALGIIT